MKKRLGGRMSDEGPVLFECQWQIVRERTNSSEIVRWRTLCGGNM